eukprot:TRINITY_DN1975_c0_g1_i2.p1 TRINITY_DN1975_c0_g1~~TRINITY_DN1975_c0_g1_i2.p1  ORF type:complete len:191 (+),score=31.14 TRINITY_DN1975_c0_g1_i2:2-574(+)
MFVRYEFALMLLCWAASASNVESTRLQLNAPLYNLTIENHGQRIFNVSDLRPEACYEVRISYLGFVPSRWRLTWDCTSIMPSHATRKLTDTEKLMFCTNTEALPSGMPCSRLKVQGDYAADPVSGQEPESLNFDLVLEPTFFKLTHNTWLLITILLILLAAAMVFVVPIMQQAINHAVNASLQQAKQRND